MKPRSEYRTVTLKLSELGIDLILDCQSRLGKNIHMLVPFGATFCVSLCLLDRSDLRRIADEVDRIDERHLHGDQPAFLPVFPDLVRKVANFAEELASDQYLFSKVPARKVYLTALYRMLTVHHHTELMEAFGRVRGLAPERSRLAVAEE